MEKELLIIANAVRTKMVISATGFGSNVQNPVDLFNMSNDMLKEIGAKIKERITKKIDETTAETRRMGRTGGLG